MLAHRGAANELCIILSDLNFNGHKSLVTPQSFARPNFTLVCQLLDWFERILYPDDSSVRVPLESLRCDKYRPNDVPEVIHIDYVKRLARKFNQILGVRLQPLQLYRADLLCCPELLKVADPIHKAAELFVSSRSRLIHDASCSEIQSSTSEVHLPKLRDFVQNSSDSTAQVKKISGLVAEFEQILGNEDGYHGQRLAVIGRQLDVGQVDRILSESYASLSELADRHRKQNEELRSDLRRLDEKLALKEQEISELRANADDLVLLQSPVYLEKQQKLRQQYDTAYQRFVSTYRTLTQLKMCLDEDGCRDDETEDVANLRPAKLFTTELVDELEKPWDQMDLRDSNESAVLWLGDSHNDPVDSLESLFKGSEISEALSLDVETMRTPRAQDTKTTRTSSDLRRSNKKDPGFELDALLDEFDAVGSIDENHAQDDRDDLDDDELDPETTEEDEEADDAGEDATRNV